METRRRASGSLRGHPHGGRGMARAAARARPSLVRPVGWGRTDAPPTRCAHPTQRGTRCRSSDGRALCPSRPSPRSRNRSDRRRRRCPSRPRAAARTAGPAARLAPGTRAADQPFADEPPPLRACRRAEGGGRRATEPAAERRGGFQYRPARTRSLPVASAGRHPAVRRGPCGPGPAMRPEASPCGAEARTIAPRYKRIGIGSSHGGAPPTAAVRPRSSASAARWGGTTTRIGSTPRRVRASSAASSVDIAQESPSASTSTTANPDHRPSRTTATSGRAMPG